MKKISLNLLSFVLAILLASFAHLQKRTGDCEGYYYWFKVKSSVYANCYASSYFLVYPPELNGNNYPDASEVVQGNDIQAEFSYGCYDSGDFCCALGFELWDIELGSDGKWKPKAFAAPMCIVQRD